MLPDDRKFSSSKDYKFEGKPAGLASSTNILTKELLAFLSVIENQKHHAKSTLKFQIQSDNSSSNSKQQDSKDVAAVHDRQKASHNDGY